MSHFIIIISVYFTNMPDRYTIQCTHFLARDGDDIDEDILGTRSLENKTVPVSVTQTSQPCNFVIIIF